MSKSRGPVQYYQFTDSQSISDKVSAAAAEADVLVGKDKTFVEGRYEDIVRALKHASTSPRIDEAYAVSELLLSVVAPALLRLDKEISDSELNAIARRIVGESASLFSLSKVLRASEEPILRATLKSRVLDVQGFPIDFPKSCNPNQQVQMELRRKAQNEWIGNGDTA